ncbi:hypothetical protein CKM354_001294400 [Cercospora kikuchii]|uniref:Secreted protein n=1 Tax=Cercospora kikuchii TaxID=84275 RepID=A0A9P3FMX3_9PEZI|nr:uncharacterized protein CKM354_001294400 [Cercospora kikuchii]GIZ49927.1 hypothetical protein CKM354_001294400 [Cercospora kikuchii]
MHLLPASLALLLLGTAALVSADARSDCEHSHPKIFKLIQDFCGGKTNMVVPEYYTQTGKVGPKDSRIWIDGTMKLFACNPAQWVPMHICRGQFYDMCAAHKKVGLFGKGGCQTWRIQYATDAKIPFTPSDETFIDVDLGDAAEQNQEWMDQKDWKFPQ